MKKIRLTVFIGSFTIGGGQRVVCETLRKLDRSLVDVTVICYESRVHTALEATVEELVKPVYLNEGGTVTLKKARRILSSIDQSKPDVVHVHLGGMAYAVPWALIRRKPLLITVHAKPEKAFPNKLLPFIRWGLRRGCIRIAAVSEENQRALQDFLHAGNARIDLVNNGIDTNRFYSKAHEHFTFINVGRQDENKNQMMILRAFARLNASYHGLRLILAGDGPVHRQMQEQAQALGVSEAVEFPGMVSCVEEYYAVSDVYVQSSYREALPMSILEAMAAELPIVATDIGGLRDIVKQNGVLVPAGDEDALYHAMHNLYRMGQDERAEMGKRSGAIVEQGYSSDDMARKYLQLYQEMSTTRQHNSNCGK